MSNRRLVRVAGVALVATLAGCGPAQAGSTSAPSTAVGAGMGVSADAGASHPASPGANADPATPPNHVAAMSAPAQPFAVGTRQLNLHRGADRPLRTVVWYPATGAAGGSVKTNGTPAAGRFPLVIFSHGLTSSPEAMQGITTKLAAAGFVVAAPAYPFTSNGAASFNAGDMANQPADASFVITEVLKLAAKAGDPLAGHIDPDRIGAGGHSAGGFTTAGMLSGRNRDSRLKAGIIVSGASMGGAFSGAATPVLFIHGDSDAVVKYAKGRAAYDNLAWPKGFVTIIGGDHVSPVTSSAALKTMVDFLRWTLYGDATARSRLASDATVTAKSRYESAW